MWPGHLIHELPTREPQVPPEQRQAWWGFRGVQGYLQVQHWTEEGFLFCEYFSSLQNVLYKSVVNTNFKTLKVQTILKSEYLNQCLKYATLNHMKIHDTNISRLKDQYNIMWIVHKVFLHSAEH